MSADAALAPLPGHREVRPQTATAAEHPMGRLVTFAALGLYGVLRWANLFTAGSTGRLLGLLALSLLVAGAGAVVARRSRPLAIAGAVVAVLAAFAIAGVPISWIVHVRIAVTARAIGHGLTGLPGSLVPYPGGNGPVRLVIVLGAAVLLLDAALLLAFEPPGAGILRRAWAALPLVALAAVPTTLLRPGLPYVDGLLVFALLMAFVWGGRIGHGRVPDAIGVCVVAVVLALFAAPYLDAHKPWLDYRALTATLAPTAVDTFDWSQNYGPIVWPRHGRTVLEVKASHGDYWKAENLDVFDGTGWTQGVIVGAEQLPQPTAKALATWTQTIEVRVRNMRTTDVIGSGSTGQPADIAQPVVPGFSPGTWTAGAELGPGDTYTAAVYSPHPSASQLAAVGDGGSTATAGYRSILLPTAVLGSAGATATSQPQIVFPPFHSQQPVESVIGLPADTGATIIDHSPYAPAYALAQRLASGAATPYAFALSIERYLASGYTYSENPPVTGYPLLTFLFDSKRGYCQQFAGAMALLLRMGGVPARVAVGFTPGTYDASTHRWVVTDIDAHAWVEAWFSGYGWVRFDPTPAADPALGGHTSITGATVLGTADAAQRGAVKSSRTSKTASAPGRHHGGTSAGGLAGPLGVALVLAALLLISGLLVATRPLAAGEPPVEELERAFARTGRPLPAGVTLAALEHRFRGAPQAAGYIRSLRLRRFGATAQMPSSGQRRALRAELRVGLRPLGRLRALWALPPRRRARGKRPDGPEGA